jgi:magnesium chelatase family protein
MVGRARTVAVVGLQARAVTVEAFVGSGLPSFSVIGSSGTAAREAAQRVRTALAQLGVSLPAQKVLVSLAPADVPKAGARFDLGMAAAVLGALRMLGEEALTGTAFLGELALDGSVRPVPGVLPAAASLPGTDVTRLVVASGNAAEAALVGGLRVVPVDGLVEMLEVLRGERPTRRPPAPVATPAHLPAADLADVRGQAEARRALEIAAAGGHHVLLLGPPGCGKSMLARRLPSILPPLERAEALEVASIHSVAGRYLDGNADRALLDRTPPFRAPHHSGSAAALLGGGTGVANPGELSLASHGVLFLDELFEWPRAVLEGLREPLEEGVVRVSRSRATVTYPAKVQLVTAANPCPCGGGAGCACDDDAVWSYRGRLSGPLADRLDLAPTLERLRARDLLDPVPGEPSAAVAARVVAARGMAAARWGRGWRNADATAAMLRPRARAEALRLLGAAVDAGELSGRGYDRALRVARTCADLDGRELIDRAHVLEARAHRLALRPPRRLPVAGS